MLLNGGINTGTWEYDRWYKISILYERTATNVFLALSVDGVQAGTFSGPLASQEDTFKYLVFDSGDGTTWIDDVRVTPESPTNSVPVGFTTIRGTVVSGCDGSLVAGASVKIGSFLATTDGSGNYSISNVPPGTYTATVSQSNYFTLGNDSGTITAGAQVVTWGFALYPVFDILSQPQSQSVDAGSTVTFTVVTKCSGHEFYHWQFNGTNLVDNAHVVGSQTDTLSISNVQPRDAGGYSVIVKPADFWTVSSSVAVLTVLIPHRSCAPQDGLVAYYPMDGNALDYSGNGINGTVHGAVLATDRFGVSNACYSFNGKGEYISAPADQLPSGARTISLWFKANEVDIRPEMLGYGGSSCGNSFFMGLNDWGNSSFVVSTHCDAYTLSVPYATPPTNQWYHWAVVMDNLGLTFYLNGQVIGSRTGTTTTSVAGTQLGLGVISSPSGQVPYSDGNVGYLDGFLDDVRIYDRALSAAEIQQLYQAESSPQSPIPTITSPPNGAVFAFGTPITVTTQATNGCASVTNISFYAGNVLLGQLANGPYSMLWTNAPLGSNLLRAVAFANNGSSATSTPVVITVIISNTAPSISPIQDQITLMNTPTPPIPFAVNDAQTPATNLVLSAVSSNPALLPVGNIMFGGSGTNRTVTLTPMANQFGKSTITITVSNGEGLSASSTFVLTVAPPPTVSITSPVDGSGFIAGTNILLTATANDIQGSVIKVEFFANGITKLGEGLTPPWRLLWSNVSAGNYVLTARATDSLGASAVSPQVNIVVSNLPPPVGLAVAITSPPKDASFCFGSAISIVATVSNSLPVAKVEFYAGDSLLSNSNSSSLQVTWPSPQVGNYNLMARVTDTAGNSATSPLIPVVVSAQCSPVAIIRSQPDSEIDALQSYLLQMGLGSQVFDQAGLTVELLNGFELVVWDDVGSATNHLTANTVDILRQIYSNGIPVYLIGEHLASTTALLASAQQMEWTNLTQLSPFTGAGGDGIIQINNPEGPSNPIIFGQFGTITNFAYPARLELATNLQSNAEVLGASAGASVLTIFPSLEAADQTPTRLVCQNLRAVPPDEPDSTNTLRALFQGSVCWLTHCQSCLLTGLGLTGDQTNEVVQVGQAINYTLTASCSGECQPAGTVVTDQLPQGFEFANASAQQGTWVYDAASQQVTFFIGLMPQDGNVKLGISAVALQAGTFTNTAGIHYNSTNPPVLLDPALVTTVLPNTNAMPPVLSLQLLSPSTLKLSLSGQVGVTYEIQSSVDLTNWTLMTNAPGPAWSQILIPTPANRWLTVFYRAKVKP